MIDFPASPAENQMFQAPGGPRYVYSNGAWRMSDPGPPGTAQARNRIVNGAMQISQENGKTGPFGGNDTYTLDQWTSGWAGTGTPNHGPFQDTVTADVDWYLRLNSSVAGATVAAGDYFRIRQNIEGIRTSDFKWGTAAAKQVVLRFKARSSIIGTFSAAINLYSVSLAFTKNCTFTQINVWQDFTVVIPGPTTGAWPTGTAASVVVLFTVKAGSSYLSASDGVWSAAAALASPGVSNWLSVAGQTFDLANVGLYLDPNATGVPPPWQMPDEAQELIACQRYYISQYAVGAGTIVGGYGATGTAVLWWVPLPTTMRVAPAITVGGVANTNMTFQTVGAYKTVDGFSWYNTVNATGNYSYTGVWLVNARM